MNVQINNTIVYVKAVICDADVIQIMLFLKKT